MFKEKNIDQEIDAVLHSYCKIEQQMMTYEISVLTTPPQSSARHTEE